MRRKLRVLKARGGKDASRDDFKSPSTNKSVSITTNSGNDGGRDPTKQFTGNNNLSKKNKDALAAQRKGARAAITPSSTLGNQILAGAMNAVIPFSGTLYKKSIDSKAMGFGKVKKKTVAPPVMNNNDNNRGGGSNQIITPIQATKPIDPLLIKPKENFFNFVAYNVGGLSGGVSYGPPPKKGPNSNVPPIKLKKGGKR